jgi:hypothetical protein
MVQREQVCLRTTVLSYVHHSPNAAKMYIRKDRRMEDGETRPFYARIVSGDFGTPYPLRPGEQVLLPIAEVGQPPEKDA